MFCERARPYFIYCIRQNIDMLGVDRTYCYLCIATGGIGRLQ